MKSLRVVGLLDKPSPDSLGMLGILVSAGSDIVVEGIKGATGHRLEQAQVDDLVKTGNAIYVDSFNPCMEGDVGAALWAGNRFVEAAQRLNIPLPPLPASTTSEAHGGKFWIASTFQVWTVIDSWLSHAFRSVVRNPDAVLAALMSRVLPGRDETRAALWLTTSKNGQERLLDWWARLDRDHSGVEVTAAQVGDRLAKLIADTRAKKLLTVAGFSAPAKGGDKEVAEYVAQVRHVQSLSFGGWLKQNRTTVDERGKGPLRLLLQSRGQEEIEKVGALAFCIEVLRGSPAVDDFVIEGIRHVDVYNSLKCLIGANRFKLFFVDSPVQDRKHRLMTDEALTPEQVELVLADKTEREIPNLKRIATATFEARLGIVQVGQRVIAELSA